MFRGDRLKEIRIKNNLSQQKLADTIGVSKSLICCYETGRRHPSLENVISFIELFGVNADYLLGSDSLVKVVTDNNVTYKPMTKEEIKFIDELKKNKDIYNLFIGDPKKMIELIKEKKLG